MRDGARKQVGEMKKELDELVAALPPEASVYYKLATLQCAVDGLLVMIDRLRPSQPPNERGGRKAKVQRDVYEEFLDRELANLRRILTEQGGAPQVPR